MQASNNTLPIVVALRSPARPFIRVPGYISKLKIIPLLSSSPVFFLFPRCFCFLLLASVSSSCERAPSEKSTPLSRRTPPSSSSVPGSKFCSEPERRRLANRESRKRPPQLTSPSEFSLSLNRRPSARFFARFFRFFNFRPTMLESALHNNTARGSTSIVI